MYFFMFYGHEITVRLEPGADTYNPWLPLKLKNLEKWKSKFSSQEKVREFC